MICGKLYKLIVFFLILLLIDCVFDPADKVFKIKSLLFSIIFLLFIFQKILMKEGLIVSKSLIQYLIIFVFIIPIVSIATYWIMENNPNYSESYKYFKTYLFLLLTIILFTNKINILIPFVYVLNVLSIITVILFLIIYFFNSQLGILILQFGEINDITYSGTRDFGGTTFAMVQFQSSPLILFNIAYYTKNLVIKTDKKKIVRIVFLLINISAMFLGATRNNMIISIFLPIIIILWYSKNRFIYMLTSAFFLFFIVSKNIETVSGMFDKSEESNSIKLTFFDDYINLFKEPRVLLIGQGVGSSFFSSTRGWTSNSELTYFELLRRLGVFLFFFTFIMLIIPLKNLFNKKEFTDHYIYISYFLYLVMSFSNPLLMSSTGMILLSYVLNSNYKNKQLQ